MKCENCRVNINSLSSNCPLCGKTLSGAPEKHAAAYPHAGEISGRRQSSAVKSLLFLTIIFSISAFIINMLTSTKLLWSLTPISGMWLTWLVLGIPIIKRKVTPLMIVLDDIAVSVFLNIIDATLNHQGWAMGYAVPFILCGSAMIITVLVLLTRVNWGEFYLFQVFIVAICFMPIIVRLFISFTSWPSIMSAAYGLFTVIGMLMLAGKKFKHETKKRFHF